MAPHLAATFSYLPSTAALPALVLQTKSFAAYTILATADYLCHGCNFCKPALSY